jgi:hypothetical protein
MAQADLSLVEVTWRDAHQSFETISTEDLGDFHRPCITRSVGYQLLRDSVGISLAGCEDEDGDWDRPLFIPAGMIVTVRVLKV